MLTINITGEVDMNILQVQDALKNASDMQLSGELQNPTGLAPSYLVLSEMKRRQQMRQGAMASPAPQSSMAEEAASQAQPEYYPEEQPQEEEAGIEAFREGGVVRMASGGYLSGYSQEELFNFMASGRPPPGYTMNDVRTAISSPRRSQSNMPGMGSIEPPLSNPSGTNRLITGFMQGAGLAPQRPEVQATPLEGANVSVSNSEFNPSRPISEWSERELSIAGGFGPGGGASNIPQAAMRNPVVRRLFNERSAGTTGDVSREARLELARRAPPSPRGTPLEQMGEEEILANMPTGSMGSYMEAETAGLRNFNPPRPSPNEVVPPPERSNDLYGPPAPPPSTIAAAPRAGASEPRGGGMPSGATQPSGQTTDPTIQALYDRLRATGQSREDYRKDAVNTGLMQAGLAMMASKDPNALANLGQGGLRGLESYTQEMRQGRLGERQGIQDEITIRRAQTEEAYRRGIITNQERQLRLSELRLGQEAGNRAETREANNAIRLEQINQRNVQALVSSLSSSASQINRIETELGSMSTSPERRDILNRQLAALQRNDANIRRRLAQVGGAEYIEEAPTQGSGRPPPGQIRQPNLWPAPQ